MKALASDFDNTLYFYDGVRNNVIEAIKEFQKEGNLFGVCTGRDIDGIVIPSEKFDIKYDFYICNSGACIVDGDLNYILHKTVSINIVKEVYKLVGNKMHLSIIYNHTMYHINNSFKAKLHFIYNCIMNKNNKYRIKNIESIDNLDTDEIEAFSLHLPRGHIKEAREIVNIINNKFGDKISVFQNNEHIDMCAIGCSKGEGIEVIKDYFNIKDDDMFVIGDSFNDLPMFDHCSNSFTFNYSDKEVKDRAKYVVENLAICINNIM